MSEADTEFEPSRWERFNNFLDKTLVPLSWLALALGAFAVVVSVINSDYDFWFWAALAIVLWSVYDIAKYYWRRRHPQEPCDHDEVEYDHI